MTVAELKRDLDKIILTAHFNPKTNNLVIASASGKTLVLDLNKREVKWELPFVSSFGMPLCMTSDQDKLVVAYDSNQIQVFDLNSMCLHEWSRAHQELP